MVVGSMKVETETLVIGAGPAGYVAAIRAAQLGKEVTMIDKQRNLGGVCLNWGCIPTKAVIEASDYYSVIQDLEEMGVEIEDFGLNFEKMREWKDGIIEKLEAGIRKLCKQHDIEIYRGKAVFDSENSIRIEGQSDVTGITFDDCILCTGSKSIQLPQFSFDHENIHDSKSILELDDIPESLAIIGGGYIGTELGTVFTKLGTDVSIIEMEDKLLPIMGEDMTHIIQDKLQDKGVDLLLENSASGFEEIDGGLRLSLENDPSALEVEEVLVVVGREPNIDGIGLEQAGIDVEDGFVKVDDYLQTSNPNVYAAGDITGNPMLAHRASRQGKVAAEVIAGEPAAYDNKVIPKVVFNDPEMAYVGMTKAEAEEKGKEVKIGNFPFEASGKAMIHRKTEGFIKVIAEKETDRVLGMEAVGPNISDVVSEAALAIEMGATAEDLANTIHPHPTNSEGLMEAADDVNEASVHIYRP